MSVGAGLAEARARGSQPLSGGVPRNFPFWERLRRNRLAVAGGLFIAVMVLVAVFAPLFAPHDPNQQDLTLAQFGEPASPRWTHPLGTDQLGRDLLSRLMHGARVSLLVGFGATGVAILAGTGLGALAGYYGRGVDTIIMRFADILLAFPPLLFLMGMLIAIPRTAVSIAILIGVIGWMHVARFVRAEFLALRSREFTLAAETIGASPTSIVIWHLLPNALSPVIVAATLSIPAAIMAESTLSFLGFGLQPPHASWGNMLDQAFTYMRDDGAWWMGVFPGLAIFFTVLAFNFLGDGVRDALDPRSERF